jgi:two-component system CheB/CheR fusion protein
MSDAASPPVPSSRLTVIGIGASAGGLEAATLLMQAWPAESAMTLILVQHLDPTGGSMMAALLAPHTGFAVCEAAEGMLLAPDTLYVMPPGATRSVGLGVLHMTAPTARHGVRMPFDA